MKLKTLALVEQALNAIAEESPTYGDLVNDASVARQHCRLLLAKEAHDQEHFGVLFLNSQQKLITARVLFHGTINGASVYPREIAKYALKLGAYGVILTHNHPSGEVKPSLADKAITERIQQALLLFDIQTHDHIIVANSGESHSMLQHGDMVSL